MEYTKDDMLEAKRQIDSTLHKLREAIKTLQAKENPARYRSQITLAERRVRAFELANALIEREANIYRSEPLGKPDSLTTEGKGGLYCERAGTLGIVL